jgi:predicted aconitase with swiveling domain
MGACCAPEASDQQTAGSRGAAVALDVFHMGPDAVIVKAGKRLCGTGCVLGNAPLLQNKSIWEITLQAQGASPGSVIDL